MMIVVDMNLSPEWATFLENHGYSAVHWSRIGNPSAPDFEILTWTSENAAVLFTHDLDFGAILAASGDNSPSVIQVRTQNLLPSTTGTVLLAALKQFEAHLLNGALITVEEGRVRARILPLH
jgi:predicted nuclease of predicted toxin-antitoxin system